MAPLWDAVVLGDFHDLGDLLASLDGAMFLAGCASAMFLVEKTTFSSLGRRQAAVLGLKCILKPQKGLLKRRERAT